MFPLAGLFALVSILAACNAELTNLPPAQNQNAKPTKAGNTTNAANTTTNENTGQQSESESNPEPTPAEKPDMNPSEPESTNSPTNEQANGNGNSNGNTEATIPNTPNQPSGSGELKISKIDFPNKIKSNQNVDVKFEVTNTGAPVKGLFGEAQIRANVGIGKIEKKIALKSATMIPANTSTQSLNLSVPSIPINAKADVCIKAYSDKDMKKSISKEFCKKVDVN